MVHSLGGYNHHVVRVGRCVVGRRVPRPENGILALLSLLCVLVCLALGGLVAAGELRNAGVAQVQILEPPGGTVVSRGETLTVHVASAGRGLVRSELLVDGVVVASVSSPHVGGLSDWSVTHSWQAEQLGQHRVSARVFDLAGGARESRSLVVAVAPPGRIVFSSNRTGAYQIHTMRTDGLELGAVTMGPEQKREASCGAGGLMLYTATPDDGASDIWLMELETGERSKLTSGLGGERWSRWAPDETAVAFISDRYGPSHLFLMNPDGSGQVQVTREEFPTMQPSWAPDGSAVLVAAEMEGNWDIFSVDVDEGSFTRLTNDPGEDLEPAWSPSGDEVAFSSNRDGNKQIYVIKANGGAPQRITTFPLGAEQPRWSPDGEWIVCVAYTGRGERLGAREIYLMRRDGSDQMRLTDNAFDDTEPDWCE